MIDIISAFLIETIIGPHIHCVLHSVCLIFRCFLCPKFFSLPCSLIFLALEVWTVECKHCDVQFQSHALRRNAHLAPFLLVSTMQSVMSGQQTVCASPLTFPKMGINELL